MAITKTLIAFREVLAAAVDLEHKDCRADDDDAWQTCRRQAAGDSKEAGISLRSGTLLPTAEMTLH
jgi:hypothetical protein